MTRVAAKKCFETAGLNPTDVDVIELHDCFSANELITYEALGLCPEGISSRSVSVLGFFFGSLFYDRFQTHEDFTFVLYGRFKSYIKIFQKKHK